MGLEIVQYYGKTSNDTVSEANYQANISKINSTFDESKNLENLTNNVKKDVKSIKDHLENSEYGKKSQELKTLQEKYEENEKKLNTYRMRLKQDHLSRKDYRKDLSINSKINDIKNTGYLIGGSCFAGGLFIDIIEHVKGLERSTKFLKNTAYIGAGIITLSAIIGICGRIEDKIYENSFVGQIKMENKYKSECFKLEEEQKVLSKQIVEITNWMNENNYKYYFY